LWEDNPTGLSQKKKKNPNEEYLNMYRFKSIFPALWGNKGNKGYF